MSAAAVTGRASESARTPSPPTEGYITALRSMINDDVATWRRLALDAVVRAQGGDPARRADASALLAEVKRSGGSVDLSDIALPAEAPRKPFDRAAVAFTAPPGSTPRFAEVTAPKINGRYDATTRPAPRTLGLPSPVIGCLPRAELVTTEAAITDRLSDEPTSAFRVARSLGRPVAEVDAALRELAETGEAVRRHGGHNGPCAFWCAPGPANAACGVCETQGRTFGAPAGTQGPLLLGGRCVSCHEAAGAPAQRELTPAAVDDHNRAHASDP